MPLFFIAAMTVGEALYAATGRQAGIDVLPLGWDVLFSVISLAVFLVPCVAAILCARRALRGGQRAGWVPLVLAGATALALTAMTVASLIDAQFR